MDYKLMGGATAAATASTSRPVPGAIEELESNLGQLQEIISALQDRLAPILGVSKPQAVESVNKAPSVAPTVANRIFGNASGVRVARDRLSDLLDRLEL